VSETVHTENPGSATALADPPGPPPVAPGAVAAGAPEPPKKRSGVVAAIVAGLIAIVLLAAVVYLVVATTGNKGNGASTARRSAFESAMHKASVAAAYPGGPVALTSVTASGSHRFSATFTPAEVAAILNTLTFESDSAGIQISLRNVTLGVPEPGTARLSAAVTANGGTYAGSVTLPLSYAGGQVSSSGATDLSIEGISGNAGQKAQVSTALVRFFNAYLAAAPGLTIDTASIGADGVTVTGSAPDSLSYP